MQTKPQTLGGGDWVSRDEIGGTLGATATIIQSANLTSNNSTTVLGTGRVVVVDTLNRRGETPASVAVGQAGGNKSGMAGVLGPQSDLANFILPGAAAEAIRRCGVLLNDAGVGQPCQLQMGGITRVLCSDTCANVDNTTAGVGALATVSFAADNSRGTVRLAATGEPVVGVFMDVPRNIAGVATDGSVAAPQFCVVDFLGGLAPFSRLAP